VDDAFAMSGVERLRDLAREVQRLSNPDRPAAHPVRQRFTLDELERQHGHTVGVFDAVDAGDVRMVERREHPRFPQEPGGPALV